MTKDVKMKQLRAASPIFASLPRRKLSELASIVDHAQVAAGTTLERSVRHAQFVYIIVSGAVSHCETACTDAGNKVVILGRDYVGGCCAAAAETLTPVRCYVAPEQWWSHVLRLVPALAHDGPQVQTTCTHQAPVPPSTVPAPPADPDLELRTPSLSAEA